MVETLNEHGRAGVVAPHGVLFRGSTEGKIRRAFIEENILKAVIGLPANLFFGTGIPACILIFDKAKGDNTDVLFIDASREYESGKNQNVLRDKDISRIYATYKLFGNKDIDLEAGKISLVDDDWVNDDNGEYNLSIINSKYVIDKYSYIATRKEIKENDYNLNIPRYVDTFEEEEPIDIAATQKEIADIKIRITKVEEQMTEYLTELGF